MSQTASRLATYADLFDLPEPIVGEILHGQLVTHPRPAPRHALVSSVLGAMLIDPLHLGRGGPGGWWILDEPELHLGPHILVPDLSGWRRERLPSLPETPWFELAPDWVCEILSPSTARVDRADKLPIYAAQAVPHLWLIDPDLRTLEAYELRDGHWWLLTTLRDGQEAVLPPFAPVSFDLAALWA